MRNSRRAWMIPAAIALGLLLAACGRQGMEHMTGSSPAETAERGRLGRRLTAREAKIRMERASPGRRTTAREAKIRMERARPVRRLTAREAKIRRKPARHRQAGRKQARHSPK